MGIFSFFRSFGSVKIDQAGQAVVQQIVSWDPETATQAEIEQMIGQLDKITKEAGKALTDYEREQKEADAINKTYDKYMTAAELLNRQVDEAKQAGDMAKAGELGSSLERLITELEEMKPEIEREVKEAQEAKEFYEEVRQLAEVTANKVRNARQTLDKARREMQRAGMQKDQAKERAERAQQLAGLTSGSSSLGIALEAMNKQTEQARQEAAASQMKAKLLTVDNATAKDDKNIAAALRLASGDMKELPTGDFKDRLAMLKR